MILCVIKRLLCNLDKNGLIFNDQIEKRPNEVLPLVTFMRLNLEWLSALCQLGLTVYTLGNHHPTQFNPPHRTIHGARRPLRTSYIQHAYIIQP